MGLRHNLADLTRRTMYVHVPAHVAAHAREPTFFWPMLSVNEAAIWFCYEVRLVDVQARGGLLTRLQ